MTLRDDLAGLVAKWRKRAEVCASLSYADAFGAAMTIQCAEQIESLLARHDAEPIAESGAMVDECRRMRP